MEVSNRTICKNLLKVVNEVTQQRIELRGRKRKQVEARGIYFTILRDFYGLPFQAIASTLGMNHASVLHSCSNFKYWLVSNKQLRDYTDETYKIIQGLTTMEKSRDTLAEKLFKAEAHIKNLQKQLKLQTTGTQEAIMRHQKDVLKLCKDTTLESIVVNRKLKNSFPHVIEQIKQELNRRYR